ncbi:hypothetical protein E0Z10_g3760 [Xylaria hypoxylon]|uniref:Zn(2)-C6 fungal-type domain-containing protein n=1 Tax=Xylaria hypoxylon TaxID=37992 RepID=A0A4Z0Z8Y2_9PEZI|nr:hypothetical protein E0Z10_g3760 [Xylaria hypoxylon]
MPPSISTIERSNPPPRRKSCAACIKAKRRCDLRQPSCLRCSQRKIDCSYLTHPESPSNKRDGDDTLGSPPQTGSSPNVQPPELMKDPLAEISSWDTNFDFNMDLDLSSSYNSSCLPFPTISLDEPAFPGLDFLNEGMSMDNALNSIPPTPFPTLEMVLEDPMPLVPRSPKSQTPQIASLSRIQLLRAASELTEKRLRYSIDVFKAAPEGMVLEGGTAWSHPTLYRDSMPTFFEDALAACALHRAKNTTNTPMIQRVIELRYHRLLAAPIPTGNASDILARAHAILLYQIMLFFDDSCAARALAEETLPALSESTTALVEFTRQADDEENDNASNPSRNIPLYPITAARTLYSDWTFQESLRRTLLMSFMFTQIQCLLRADFSGFMSSTFAPTAMSIETCLLSDPSRPPVFPSQDATALAAINHVLQQTPYGEEHKCDTQLLICRSFTLSAHLWHARDPVEFAVAWRDKKHLVAQPWTVWKRIDTAQADDIDQLGRILMTSGMGIEETKGWFASRGSSL